MYDTTKHDSRYDYYKSQTGYVLSIVWAFVFFGALIWMVIAIAFGFLNAFPWGF